MYQTIIEWSPFLALGCAGLFAAFVMRAAMAAMFNGPPAYVRRDQPQAVSATESKYPPWNYESTLMGSQVAPVLREHRDEIAALTSRVAELESQQNTNN